MKTKLLFLLIFISTIQLRSQNGLQILTNCQDTIICTDSLSCEVSNFSTSISALTDCTDDLINYNFQIDFFADGTIDSLGASPTLLATYPVGSHLIKFTVYDFCGQVDSCEILVEVNDCEAPIVEFLGVLDTFIMPYERVIDINLQDLNSINAFDNCTSPENLYFSHTPNIEDTIISICCDQILTTGEAVVTVYITDEIGLSSFIIIYIQFLDPNGSCVQFDGLIPFESLTWYDQELENTNFQVNGLNWGAPHFNYTLQGCSPLPLNNFIGDTLTPSLESPPLNGVTTFDLVLISKHILGIEILDNPYQLLAADVNKSGTITALDIVIIRKLILLIDDEFPSEETWIFDPPFIVIDTFFNNFSLAFTGYKLGDVNGSADPNNLQNSFSETRNHQSELTLSIQDQLIQKGQTYTISVFAKNFKDMIGGQFALSFDPTALQFVSIQSSFKDLNEHNFGLSKIDDGIILCSWNSPQREFLNTNKEFYNITFTSNKNGELSDFFSLNSNTLKAEAYLEKENEIEMLDISLQLQNTIEEKNIEVIPNPFHEKTKILFQPNESREVFLKIYDQNGRVVFSHQKQMDQGENYFEIQKYNLPSTGIYLFQIKADDHIWNGKLSFH